MLKKLLVNQAKSFYDFCVSKISLKASRQTTNNEIAYVLSFPNNDEGLITEISEAFPEKRLVIYYSETCLNEAQMLSSQGLEIRSLDQPVTFFRRVIPALSRTKMIICDNYFPFLANLVVQPETRIIQIWHANGAIKNFGWQDKKTQKRSQSEKARFQKVYNSFTDFIVGSDAMAEIFKEAYRVQNDKFQYLGLPRTDFYFANQNKGNSRERLIAKFPELKNKQILLYAPTYREHSLTVVDWTEVLSELTTESILVCKFHPKMLKVLPRAVQDDPRIIIDLKGVRLAEWLLIADYLISDYSSVPFEYALANPQGKLLFFCPDLAEYQGEVGIQAHFQQSVAGGLSQATSELISQINQEESANLGKINEVWNRYNDGQASQRLVNYMKIRLKEEG